MPFNPKIHHRKSIRKRGYDYSQAGLYFITICVQNRQNLFGEIVVGANPAGYPEMKLNDAGRMIENEWLKIPQRLPNIQLHEYAVMPNHFHAIMEIVGATLVVSQTTTTGALEMGQTQGLPLLLKTQPCIPHAEKAFSFYR